jgi:hypothetical protein
MNDEVKDSKTKPFKRSFNAVALSDLVPELLDPVLQKRAGLTTALIGAWPEIAGERIGQFSAVGAGPIQAMIHLPRPLCLLAPIQQ